MSKNIFFVKKKIKLKKLYPEENFNIDFQVNDIKPLLLAQTKDITFFDTINYKDKALRTKASLCITTSKLSNFLPKKVRKIIVENVLFELARITKIIYPYADIDYPDFSLKSQVKLIIKRLDLVIMF